MKNFIFLASTLLFSISAQAKYEVSFADQGKYEEITFSGEILPFNSMVKIRRIVKNITGKKDIVLKVAGSGGGYPPKFKTLAKKIKKECQIKRKAQCKLRMVFTSYCASACTYLPLYADYSVSTILARFGFHRKWMFHHDFTIKSVEATIKEYLREGWKNEKWLRENAYILTADQEYCHYITKEEEIESQLIDHQVRSAADFYRQFPNFKRR